MLTASNLLQQLVAALGASEAQVVEMLIGLQDDGLLPADLAAPLGTDDLVNVALALIANVDRSRIVERETDVAGWH